MSPRDHHEAVTGKRCAGAAVLAALCCFGCAPSVVVVSGRADGGVVAGDGGSGRDAGGGDTGTSGDAGAAPDAGGPRDAGADAGAPRPDAGFTADAGPTCAPVTVAADVDPWSVRVPGIGFGGAVTVAQGGHTDVFLKSPLPADYTRVGARLDWGGALVFYGLTGGANVLDGNDPGREVQLAVYDPARSRQPCAGTASCATSTATCGASITFLGWNPVQGGDECGHGSVATWTTSGDSLFLAVQPLQWNPDWARPDCTQTACGAAGVTTNITYQFELRYVETHVVELTTEVRSQETFDHGVTGQEFPTLYVGNGLGGSADLPVLVDSAGTVRVPSTPANDGFLVGQFTSPQPWMSWQNTAQTYGVALAMDQGIGAFQAWRGDGVSAPYFHNVRASIAFGLPAGGVVRGRSYLALGALPTIQSALGAVLAKRPPFGVVDAPAASTTTSLAVGQPLALSGWVLDGQLIASVGVEVDGAPVAALTVSGVRPDVCAIYPGYAGCPQVGFSGAVSTAGWSACSHRVSVVAKDPDNNRTVLAERLVVLW